MQVASSQTAGDSFKPSITHGTRPPGPAALAADQIARRLGLAPWPTPPHPLVSRPLAAHAPLSELPTFVSLCTDSSDTFPVQLRTLPAGGGSVCGAAQRCGRMRVVCAVR